MAIDFQLIRQTAVLRAEELLTEWYPNGRVRGAEFVVGNADGEVGDSLSINLNKGVGADFATGEKFGDLIDVYAARFNVSVGEAAKALADKLGIKMKGRDAETFMRTGRPRKPPAPTTWQAAFNGTCHPIPDEADVTPAAFAIPQRGAPDHVYIYRDTDGAPMWVVTRWDASENDGTGKHFAPWYWSDGWVRKAPPTPRMPYGLEQLTKRKVAIITEGEKACEAARRLFPSSPVLTWPNGAAAVRNTDWSALTGRRVLIWPDADAPGFAAMNELAAVLTPIVELPIRYIDPGVVATGFDAADLGNMTEAQAHAWAKPKIKSWEPPELRKPIAEINPAPTPTETPQDAPGTPVVTFTYEAMGLETDPKGRPYASLDNAVRALGHVLTADDVHYDSFLNQMRWRTPQGYVRLEDHHIMSLTIALQRDCKLQALTRATVADAVHFVSKARVRNCLQDWMNNLQWDNVPRIETMMIRGFGAQDTDYSRAVGRNFMIGMAARAMRPGCQLDTLPILEGAQGIGKSRGLAALGGEWYADIDSAMGTREFAEQIQGKWLVELSELSAMRPSEVERVKSTITRTSDVYRQPFAVLATDHPRQCVFAGTTNADHYLHDVTGNRRFWPIRCGTIDRDWIRDNRDQLFAEARTALTAGTIWWDMDADLAAIETRSRVVSDSLHDRVREYTDLHTGLIRINDILAAWGTPEAQWSAPLQRRIADALKALGYRSAQVGSKRAWKRDKPAEDATTGQRDNHGTITGQPRDNGGKIVTVRRV